MKALVKDSIQKRTYPSTFNPLFWVLTKQRPLTIYDIWRKLRDQRDFAYIRYHIVNRRLRALADHGFVEKIGQRRTRTGFVAVLYQLTARAYLAIVLDKIGLDEFIEKAPEGAILGALGAFSLLS